ncbi:MAG: M56 family metallopeptidase [Planctomycetota bacterium]|jgi:beta-lactamase regulating signal transducer with metallopeptidase domain
MNGFANLVARDEVLAFGLSVLAQCTVLIAGALVAARLLRHNAAARGCVLTWAVIAALACPVVTAVMWGCGVTLMSMPLASDVSDAQPTSVATVETDDLAVRPAAASARAIEVAAVPGPLEPSPEPPGAALPEPARAVTKPPANKVNHARASEPRPGQNHQVSLANVLRSAVSIGLGVWMLGGVVCCAGIARSWWRVRRLLRAARPIEAKSLDDSWSQVKRSLRIRVSPPILTSSDLSSPVVAGVFRPVILLPVGLCGELSRAELRTVLLHEAAHVVRRDQLVLCMQQWLAVIFWVHPLVHRLNGELARACDEVCDNYVLRTTDAPDYGATLLRLARLLPQMQPAAAIGLFRPRRKLERRISTLLDERRQTMVRTSVWGLAASGAVMALLLVIGGGTALTAPTPEVVSTFGPSQADQATPGPAGASKAEPDKAADVFDFRGRVVDPEGKPVEGAKLYMIYGIHLYGGPVTVPAPKVRAVTDIEGNFRFTMMESEFDDAKRGPGGMVVAMADGYGVDFGASYCFDVSGKSVERFKSDPMAYSYALSRIREADGTLRLVKDDVPLVGRIVDPDGRPVAGATVRVAGIRTSRRADLTPWLDAVNKGEDYGVTSRLLDKMIGSPSTAQMLRHIMPVATTGREGAFRLPWGIGRHRIARLLIEGPGITSEVVYARTQPGPTLRVPRRSVGAMRGTYKYYYYYYGANFEHVARRSIPIVGTVRDKDTGGPLVGARIRVRPGQVPVGGTGPGPDKAFARDSSRAQTDEEGRYRLTGVPLGTDHSILAFAPDQPYLISWKQVDLSEGQQSVQVDFELKRGIEIHGRITDAQTGKPVQACVTYFVFADNPHSRSAPFFRGGMFSPNLGPYQTNKEGRYAIPGLPGRGIVAAFAQDHVRYPRGVGGDEIEGGDPTVGPRLFRTNPYILIAENFHCVAEVNPAEGAEGFRQDFVLDPGQTLEGTVLDPTGQPISGAYAHGHNKYSTFSEMRSPDFHVILYEPGEPRTLLFVHKERKLAGGRVLKGPQKSPVTVQLEPWGEIAGRLVNADGKPQVNVWIQGWAFGEPALPGYGVFPEQHYLTDQQGRFHIEGLVPGIKYDLVVIKEGYRVGREVVVGLTVTSGEIKDLGDVVSKPVRRSDLP